MFWDEEKRKKLSKMRDKMKYFKNLPESVHWIYSAENVNFTDEEMYILGKFLYDYASSKNVFMQPGGFFSDSMEYIFRIGDKYIFAQSSADYEDPDDYIYDNPDWDGFMGYSSYISVKDDLTLEDINSFFKYVKFDNKTKGSIKLDPIDVDYLFDFYKKIGFEDRVTSRNVVEQFLANPKWLEQNVSATDVTRMFGYDQKNSHHCYDLMEHTLRAVEAIKREDLTEEEFTKLRVAAFFHDIGKPDVASFNEKTGQQVFYGHAAHSAEVAKPILEELGYSEDEITEICFYIAHHDDFISYKTNMQPWMENHEYIREITPDTVSEVIIRNKYDFEAMGYDEHQTKYICYTLGHNGEEPNFMLNSEPVKIDVNMDEACEKIESGKYNSSFIPTARNYDMLLRLCKADALAQSEIAMQNGKQVGTRKEKVENIENIQMVFDEAFHSVSDKVVEYSDEFIQKILLLAARKVDSREQSEKAQALLKEFEKISKPHENDSIGE